MNKTATRRRAFAYLKRFGNNISAKFSNICGKTGAYDIPGELFLKRTARSDRILMPWKDVLSNKLTMEQLESFKEGGVVVEFANDDYFNPLYQNNNVFKELKKRLGGNGAVASVITIRGTSGTSSSAFQRECFDKLTSGSVIVEYKGQTFALNKSNYRDYVIRRLGSGGKGNGNWEGFIFFSIKGGQQDTIETHKGQELCLFNPACEYARSDVCEDINLVLAYFALRSIDKASLSTTQLFEYNSIVKETEEVLRQTKYDIQGYNGNLLDYCNKHPSLALIDGQLTDPIQIRKINISHFDISTRSEDSIDLTHDEAVVLGKYYWDNDRGCLLSPCRPTNIFWSFHLSNMIQQNYSLEECFQKEEERVEKRKKILKGEH